jgi:hypothetical protein
MKKLIRQILREQVSEIEIESGFEEFYNLLREKFDKIDKFDQIFEELEIDIKKSPTPKITITDRGMFCGMSLTSNVILNKSIFNNDLHKFIFILFHEIAHQYQYKKYGKNLLYELTTTEVTDNTLNKLIKIEQVADRFGRTMASKYATKFNLPARPISSPYDSIEYGKSSYKRLIEDIQKKINDGEITCVEQMESFMLDHLTKPYTPSYSYTGSTYYPKYDYGTYNRSSYSTYDDSDYDREYSRYELAGRSGLEDDIEIEIIEKYSDILENLKYEINQEINEIIGEVENVYGDNGSNIFRDLLNQEGFKNFYHDNEHVKTDEPVDDIEELAFKVDEDFYPSIEDLKSFIEERLQRLMDDVEQGYGIESTTILSELIYDSGFDELWIEY